MKNPVRKNKNWIIRNKKWLFSGIGVTVLVALFKCCFMVFMPENDNSNKEKNNLEVSGEVVKSDCGQDYEEGYYLKEFIPTAATYPFDFPY